jgi:nucleoside 2-deoxyribosyltransferase
MSYLAGKHCYLSGPIQHDPKKDWRTRPSKYLKDHFDIALFDPNSDPKQQWVPKLKKAQRECNDKEMKRIAKNFVHKDLLVVDRSDFIIAYLPYGVPTYGTTHEIIISHDVKKPTLLVSNRSKYHLPFWFWGMVNPKHMFGSWKALYAYLEEVNAGKHRRDFSWSYVYGLI